MLCASCSFALKGANLGTYGQLPWCDFGGVVSPGKLIKLDKKQLRPHCKTACKNTTVEHDDGSVNNKTVCSKVRCDSNDIEDQRVRIVCTSPPGAGATGSVIVKLAPSFNPTAFTRVPGDYTFFASTAIASVSPKSLSPKGSVVTLRINTEVPARNVLCRFGHKQHLPPFKWEGGITVAAVGHPLAAEAALTLEKVDNGTAKPSEASRLPASGGCGGIAAPPHLERCVCQASASCSDTVATSQGRACASCEPHLIATRFDVTSCGRRCGCACAAAA